MKNLLKIMALCILVAMQSCSSEEEPQYKVTNQAVSKISKMVVRFDGKIYETDVKETGDSVSYLNEEYAKIYRNKISNADDMSAVLYTDENGVSLTVETFRCSASGPPGSAQPDFFHKAKKVCPRLNKFFIFQ